MKLLWPSFSATNALNGRAAPMAPRRPFTSPLARAFLVIAAVVLVPRFSTAASPAPGTKLWEFMAGGEIYSSPAIAPDGTIYFGSRDHNLYALTPDGKEKWKFQTGERIDAAPAIGPDGTVYVGSFDDILYAISPVGQARWQFATKGAIAEAAAVGADGTVYCVSQDANLYAFGSNGAKKWQFATGGPVPPPSVGREGTVYIGNKDGFLYALDPNGAVKWKYPVRDSFGNTGVVASSCALDEAGTVYFLSEAGAYGGTANTPVPPDVVRGNFLTQSFAASGLHAVGLDGRAAFVSSQASFSWTPTIGPGGVLYGATYYTSGPLVSVSPDGTLRSSVFLLDPVSKNPMQVTTPLAVASDGTLYWGASVNNFFFLLATDSAGTMRWKFDEPLAAIYSPPVIGTNGTVYFGCNDKKLYAVAGGSGPGSAPWPMYRANAQHTGSLAAPTLDHAALGIGMYAGLVIHGNVGSTFRIESQDRITGAWSAVGTVTLDRTPYLFFDLESTNAANRFYRAILVSP